ncbi:type II toxin-antitoxin system RelE/ParE family toxin [Nocardia cyriacigeorgica]|uniref:type II toxin-antitoxin system RelE/ParE family toxin n=1 Tax=Nocardia cyriacigeorgica TaxID=135487 RepID=UPI002454ED22|nr:type II toxin-antitoxin system RelE/ParE family toxin [Nocardia cyriacigeorgica]
MDPLYSIEIEPEVRAWLESLPAKHFLKVEEYVGLLAEHALTLGEPFSRHLGEGVRELRPTLDGGGHTHHLLVSFRPDDRIAHGLP